jgi:DNA repair protein RadC
MNPGIETMPDAELVALFLQSQQHPQQALATAVALLEQFGTIRGIIRASITELQVIAGVCEHSAKRLSGIQELSCRYFQQQLVPGTTIQSPTDSRQYLIARLRDKPQEVFCALFLDNRHRVLAFEELFFGTIDATTVYPREILRRALHRNAAAIILAHNHPSGVAEPSAADQNITRRIRDALELIDVRLLDHFVIGDGSCVSLAARGML